MIGRRTTSISILHRDVDDWLMDDDMTSFMIVVWIMFCISALALDVWMLWPVIENFYETTLRSGGSFLIADSMYSISRAD